MIIWKHRSTRDMEIAEFTVGSLTARVQDCDGDMTEWYIKEGLDEIIESGTVDFSISGKNYHFDVAKDLVIQNLIPIARKKGLYSD